MAKDQTEIRMEISRMNCNKRYRSRSPNRKARLVRQLDFLSSTKDDGSYGNEGEDRYSEFPPNSPNVCHSEGGPVYQRFETITGHSPVYYRIPRVRRHTDGSDVSSFCSIEQFDKRRWLHFFNENLEGYLHCLSSTNGTLRHSVILHLNEEIIPKYVVKPTMECSTNYEKCRQILTTLSSYKACSVIMSHALQALDEVSLSDPLVPESARGIQDCEFQLRQTMKSENLASESLADQRIRIRVYGHLLCFLILHYSKGNFTTYPGNFDVRSFDAIHKTLQDIVRGKNDTELEVVVGFTTQCLTVVRYPKGKFKRCCDNLGKCLKSLDDIAVKGERRSKTQPDRELSSVVEGHTLYGTTLFLFYLALKTKYHHGNAYLQFRMLQMMQKLVHIKMTEMINKRPWRSGSIREKKKDWVFIYCAACVLIRVAKDTSLSRELRICSVVEADEVFSLTSLFNNTALQKVSGYIRGLALISELCQPLVYSDIDVVSFHTGHLLLMKNEEFNTAQLRDGINKKYLCNLHRNFGLNLNDVLHQGDTSLVYKGTIIGAKQSVIVKICVVHTVEELHLIDTQAAKKLNNEITILRELDHPNIVPVLAYWNSAPPLHYISTFASHGSLLRYLRINRNRNIVIPQQLLYRIALDVVMALRHLGDKDIVHRNIMARKVFLCNDNGEIRVLLGGFEHAVKMSEGTSQHQGTIDESMAVYWSAAESLLYQRYSIKSDVWMFAVLCYELFTLGCEPYQDYHELTIEDVMFKIVHHRLRFKKPDCIHDVMFQLMMECMDINPSKRPSYDVITSTINDVISRIKNAADLPGRSMTSRPPILQVRRGSFGNVAIGNELDDEYVYCTTGKDKRPGGIEARFQNDNISTKAVNELQGNLLNPPPDLLIRAGHSGQLDQCITENIDHIVRKDEPVVCTTQSITADDQPNIQTQLIENPINPSLNGITEKLEDGTGLWFLQDVIPSLGSCTYVTETKGLIFGRQYLLSEYPDEGDLASFLLSKQCTSRRQIQQFVLHVTSGLYELHQNGFIHRDLRLQHCYVLRNQYGQQQAKIGRLARVKRLTSDCLTHICSMESDSLRWSAPEVITSGVYSKASDVFSLGCLLWQLYLHVSAPIETTVLRLIPYCTVEDTKVIEHIKQRRLPLQPPACPDRMYALIQKCWSLSPQQRPDVAIIVKEITRMCSHGSDSESLINKGYGQCNRPLPETPSNGYHGYRRQDPIYETIPADHISGDEKTASSPTKARVLYDYIAKEENEINVRAGDVIIIKELVNHGWWKGEINGKCGLLPSNYVEVIACEEVLKLKPEADCDGYLIPHTDIDHRENERVQRDIVSGQHDDKCMTSRKTRQRTRHSDKDDVTDKEERHDSGVAIATSQESEHHVPRSWICADTSPNKGNTEDPYILSTEPYYNVLPSRPKPLPGKITRSQSLKLRRNRLQLEERALSQQTNTEDPHYQVPKQMYFTARSAARIRTPLTHDTFTPPEAVNQATTSNGTKTAPPTVPSKSNLCQELQKDCQRIMKKFAPLPDTPDNVTMETSQAEMSRSKDFAKSVYQNFQPHYENLQTYQSNHLERSISRNESMKDRTKMTLPAQPGSEVISDVFTSESEIDDVDKQITSYSENLSKHERPQVGPTHANAVEEIFDTGSNLQTGYTARFGLAQTLPHSSTSSHVTQIHKSTDDMNIKEKSTSKRRSFRRCHSFTELSQAETSTLSEHLTNEKVKDKRHKRRSSFSAPMKATPTKDTSSNPQSSGQTSAPSTPSKVPFLLRTGLLPSPSALRRSLRRSLSRTPKKSDREHESESKR